MTAELNIEVSQRNGCSYLKKAFFTTPLKVANITEDKTSEQLQLMLMSSSPGILDGDHYDLKITIEELCCLQLQTQSYQRLFNMKRGATQQLQVTMKDNSDFCFLPHPSVPHEESIFKSSNSFYLGANCKLIFGEVLTCGRKLNGEVFLFSKYHSVTSIYINDKLVIKENLLMQPSLVNVHAIGQLEGYTHQASMIWLQERIDMKAIQSILVDMLSGEKNMAAGISLTPVNGLLIRLLGYGAEHLYDSLQSVYAVIQKHTVKKSLFIPLA